MKERDLRYSCPARCLYLRPEETKDITERLEALRSELSVEESPIIIHCIGSAGLSLYSHLRQVNQEIIFQITDC